MAYCTNCGAKLNAGAKFCENCGSIVETRHAPGSGTPPRNLTQEFVSSRESMKDRRGEQPKEKSYAGKNVFLLILAAALLVACILVVPGRIREARNGEPEDSRPSDRAEEIDPDTGGSGSSGKEAEAWVFPEETAGPDAEQTPLPEESYAGEGEPRQEAENDELTGSEPAAQNDEETQSANPEYGEFAWYTDAWNGIPSDAAILTDFPEIQGTWKGLIVYDPDHQYASYANELIVLTIGGSADALRMTVQPCSLDYGDGPEDESGSEPWELEGAFGLADAFAQGICTITINTFYSCGGNRYAVGDVETPGGIPADIVLMK